ncbi:MAG TPA: thioredoxin domain-containing protein [Gammaproteobacteria bacterium]|nr:thioredoxin domain-containing protein [Gammaproteobacteria bacterium]
MNHGNHRIELVDAPNRTDHSLGPDHAPVVLVEYGDYECSTCKQAAPVVEQLRQRFEEQVRFIFRHFPLIDAHSHALAAAEAAECAGGQGKFWEMHALLFEHQTHLDLEHLLRYGADLGLDVARYTAEIDDEVYRQRVLEHIDSGKRSGVRGAPTFFLNGRFVDVSFGLHSLSDAVEGALHARRGRAV